MIALKRGLYRIWRLRRGIVLMAALPALGLWVTSFFEPLIAGILAEIREPLLSFALLGVVVAAFFPVGFLRGLRLVLAFAMTTPLIVPIWQWSREVAGDTQMLATLAVLLPTVVAYQIMGGIVGLLGRVSWPWPIRSRSVVRVAAPAERVLDFLAPPLGGPFLDRGIDSMRAEGDLVHVRFAGGAEAPHSVEVDPEAGTVSMYCIAEHMGIAEGVNYRVYADDDGSVVEQEIIVERVPFKQAIAMWLEDAHLDFLQFMRETVDQRPGVSLKRTRLNMIFKGNGQELIA